jgi:hypothetical protein
MVDVDGGELYSNKESFLLLLVFKPGVADTGDCPCRGRHRRHCAVEGAATLIGSIQST